MKISKLALRPQVELKSVPTGVEFAQYLVNEAGIDSARMRAQIEDACLSDLKVYFEGKKLGFTREWLLTLVKAELAGGSFAATNMPARLQRQMTRESAQEIAEIAADISILLQEKRSDFNYFRYSLNAVSTVMGDLFDENHFEILGLKKSEQISLQSQLNQILTTKLSDVPKLMQWLEDVTNLHYQVINLHETDKLVKEKKDSGQYGEQNENNSVTRNSKLYVSTKSMSTYKLRVFDYALMQSKKFLKSIEKLREETEYEFRFLKYMNYKSQTFLEIKKLLSQNNSKSEQVLKYLNSKSSSVISGSTEIVSVTEYLSKERQLRISFTGSGVSSRLIKPVLNSLKSQLSILPNQKLWKSEAKSGKEFLSVEIDILRSEDLAKIEKILQLHSQ